MEETPTSSIAFLLYIAEQFFDARTGLQIFIRWNARKARNSQSNKNDESNRSYNVACHDKPLSKNAIPDGSKKTASSIATCLRESNEAF